MSPIQKPVVFIALLALPGCVQTTVFRYNSILLSLSMKHAKDSAGLPGKGIPPGESQGDIF